MSESKSVSTSPRDDEPATIYTLNTAEDVEALVSLLDSSTRTHPAVIVSVARKHHPYPVAPSDIANELRDVADVYVLADSDLAWELDPYDDYRTYGGAVRIVGLSSRGSVIRTDGDPAEALERIISSAHFSARQARTLRVVRNHDQNKKTPTATTESELEYERAKRMRAEEKSTAMVRELAAARAEIARLRAELDFVSTPMFDDPETQFRDDVERSWLRQIVESDRPQWSLREFRVGPRFLDSLDMPQASRRKIIEVVVDVLTRRAFEMPARSVRAQGDGGPAGVNGQVVRPDGATGYRCNIRANTPQAPRLMWWELTDGTVELALAGRHDDPMPG